MRIETIHEQGTGPLNEDFLVTGENLFGVFDGATSLDRATFGRGRTGGFLASNIAGRAFRANDRPLKVLAHKANGAIMEAMEACRVDLADKSSLWSTSAAVVRIHDHSFEWVQIGDCQIMAIHTDGSHTVLVPDFDHDFETLSMWKDMAGQADAPILETLREQILRVRKRMNVTYGVFNGEPEAMEFVNHGTMPLQGVTHLLIFTDGLFIPKSDPGERENFDRFADLFRNGGLTGVRDHVRELEARDRTCARYPRFKPNDDIAAISIAIDRQS